MNYSPASQDATLEQARLELFLLVGLFTLAQPLGLFAFRTNAVMGLALLGGLNWKLFSLEHGSDETAAGFFDCEFFRPRRARRASSNSHSAISACNGLVGPHRTHRSRTRPDCGDEKPSAATPARSRMTVWARRSLPVSASTNAVASSECVMERMRLTRERGGAARSR